MRSRCMVVSRGMIAEHVWDAELDIDSNVVEVYLGYLRRKVARAFGRNDLETVRGTGSSMLDWTVPGADCDEHHFMAKNAHLGVRARVTIAASSVLAAVLTIGAVALVALVHQSLLTNLDSAASTRAQDISSLVSSASVPATLPAQPDDSNLIQVVD
jgi:hypothetical protein